MDDLIGRLVAHAGVDRTAAVRAVGVIAQLPLNEEPLATARARIRPMRSPRATMSASSSSVRSPRILGVIGGAVDQIHAIAGETPKLAREKAREGASGTIVGALPGLGQFV
jgi:hypothetical protein